MASLTPRSLCRCSRASIASDFPRLSRLFYLYLTAWIALHSSSLRPPCPPVSVPPVHCPHRFPRISWLTVASSSTLDSLVPHLRPSPSSLALVLLRLPHIVQCIAFEIRQSDHWRLLECLLLSLGSLCFPRPRPFPVLPPLSGSFVGWRPFVVSSLDLALGAVGPQHSEFPDPPSFLSCCIDV
jgi:hypothetical protein